MALRLSSRVRLIVSDVDETVADLYLPAEAEMVAELEGLLRSGRAILFITGQSLRSVEWRIVEHISPGLRRFIFVGHCSGAEVWGFDEAGGRLKQPFYSFYESRVSESERRRWREVVRQLVTEFQLQVYPASALAEFQRLTGGDPLAVMLEDRGPQITFEFVNSYELTAARKKLVTERLGRSFGGCDLRDSFIARASELLHGLPITPRAAGVFAVDMAIAGVSKTDAVRFVVESDDLLKTAGLARAELMDPAAIEVWGDKFSVTRGGTDRHMSEALAPAVLSISFRDEDPAEFLPGFNIQIWRGEKRLHHGLLEYLRLSRRQSPQDSL